MYAISNVLSPFLINLFLIPLDIGTSEAVCGTTDFQSNATLWPLIDNQHTTKWPLTNNQQFLSPKWGNDLFNSTPNNMTAWLKDDGQLQAPLVTSLVRSNESTSDADQTLFGLELTRWAFTVGSSCSLLAALLLSVGFLPKYSVKLSDNAASEAKESSVETNIKTRALYVAFLFFSALLTLFWAFTAGTLIQYLQTYAIVGLKWPTAQSSYLNGILGAGQVAGSLATIFLSKIIARHTLFAIGISLGFWIVGVMLMLFASISVTIWAGMMVGGASLAGKILPSYFLYRLFILENVFKL